MDLKLLDIEHALSGPDKMTALQQYDAVLIGLDTRLTQALDAGLPREAYLRAEKLKAATLIARKLLRLAVKEGDGLSPATSDMFNS